MENYEREKRECLFCGTSLSGRKDKKFCDDSCRNNHYYNTRKNTNLFINGVNDILRNNRSVLKSLCCHTKVVVKKQMLEDMGFKFDYMTSLHLTRRNVCYRLVYDYAYRVIGENVVVMRY